MKFDKLCYIIDILTGEQETDINHPIYTTGYQATKFDGIVNAVHALDAQLVDIRFFPGSRNPIYTKSSFASKLGGRYVHIKALGNKNFKSGPEIILLDPPAGVEAIRKITLRSPALLMCACRDYEHCHRKTVAELLRSHGFTVSELDLEALPGSIEKPRSSLLDFTVQGLLF